MKRPWFTNRYRPHQSTRERERRVRQRQQTVFNQIDRAKRAGHRAFHEGVELAVGLTRTGRERFYTAG